MDVLKIAFVIVSISTIFFLMISPKTSIKTILCSFIGIFKGPKWHSVLLSVLSYCLLPIASGTLFYFVFQQTLNNAPNEMLLTFDSTLLALLTIFFGIDGLVANSKDPNHKRFSKSIDETMGVLFVSILLVMAKMVLVFFLGEPQDTRYITIHAVYYGITGFVVALFIYVMHSFYNHKHRQNSSCDENNESN